MFHKTFTEATEKVEGGKYMYIHVDIIFRATRCHICPCTNLGSQTTVLFFLSVCKLFISSSSSQEHTGRSFRKASMFCLCLHLKWHPGQYWTHEDKYGGALMSFIENLCDLLHFLNRSFSDYLSNKKIYLHTLIFM